MKHQYWFWKNLLSIEERKTILNYIENNYDFIEEKNLYDESLKNTEKVKCIEWQNIKKLNVIDKIIDCMQTTNDNNFGYNLTPFRNRSSFNLTVYSSDTKSEYKWHTDASSNPYKDIKLTGLINLSTEKYEGGEFQLNYGKEFTIPEFSEGGDVILFKSHILHRVLPITKGIRKSLAIFFEGPRFT